jgi:hypothetical protein
MSAIVSGLFGAVVAFALVTIAERRQKSATTLHDGWKALRPGWLINGAIVGCTAFAALMGYFLLSGGSSRPDAATQNGYAVLLLTASVAGAAYIAWTTYGRTVMWKGNELRVRSLSGCETVQRISDVTSARKSEMLGEYRVRFRDGKRLWFSAHLHGANELVAKLPCSAFGD